MPWNRRSRLRTALFALISLLFMQLALANYVCPGVASSVAEAATMAEAGMPCAQSMALSMDDAQPNLCQAHCQAGQQSADKYEPLAPLLMADLPADFRLPALVTMVFGAPRNAPDLMRSTAPPVAIRNCCFRL